MNVRYPVYVPSRGRADVDMTTAILRGWGVPHFVVVEPHEAEEYQATLGAHELCTILAMRERDQGLVYARNWILGHAMSGADHIDGGAARHWQLDDNIKSFRFRNGAKSIEAPDCGVLTLAEDFVDRYTNVGIAGLMHTLWAWQAKTPFLLNKQVYSCVLVDHSTGIKWRGRQGDDTDYSLQVLAAGLCTVLFAAFQIQKADSESIHGGNTDMFKARGKLDRAREMERRWPGVVTVRKAGKRTWAHADWAKFDQQLVRVK